MVLFIHNTSVIHPTYRFCSCLPSISLFIYITTQNHASVLLNVLGADLHCHCCGFGVVPSIYGVCCSVWTTCMQISSSHNGDGLSLSLLSSLRGVDEELEGVGVEWRSMFLGGKFVYRHTHTHTPICAPQPI